jgi:hypothetical protein
MLWPAILIHACLIGSPGVCKDVTLFVNIEDRGLLGAEAMMVTCQMTFFRTALLWEQEHPSWRSERSECALRDPDRLSKDL